MGMVMDIINDFDNRSVSHYADLRRDICTEIERLHEQGTCPEELWKCYDDSLNVNSEEDEFKAFFIEVMMPLLYIDEHESEMPKSIIDILVDYKEHPEKVKE